MNSFTWLLSGKLAFPLHHRLSNLASLVRSRSPVRELSIGVGYGFSAGCNSFYEVLEQMNASEGYAGPPWQGVVVVVRNGRLRLGVLDCVHADLHNCVCVCNTIMHFLSYSDEEAEKKKHFIAYGWWAMSVHN